MAEELVDLNDENGWSLLKFAAGEALQWGKADLLALGPDPEFTRISELAVYFAAFAAGGSRDVEAVWVVLPPVSERHESPEVAFRAAFTAAMIRISRGQVAAGVTEERLASLAIKTATSFDGESLIELLETAPARTALIVADARQFRFALGTPRHGERNNEDDWCAHVHRLLSDVDLLCSSGNRYVVLELGSHPPSRPHNLDLLQSVGDAGFYAREGPNSENSGLSNRVSRWIDFAKTGHFGSALNEIETDTTLSDRQRLFLKLEVYSSGGLHEQARELLRVSAEMLDNLPVDQALNVARVCELVDEDDRAEALVSGALPNIITELDFVHALEVAENTGRRNLSKAVTSAFKKLHPKAPVLRRLEIVECIRACAFSRVAELLNSSEDPEDRSLATYYDILALQTAASEWIPKNALKAVIASLPGLYSEAVIHIARALEREHRRLDGVVFLLEQGSELGNDGLLNLIRIANLSIQSGDMSSSDEKVDQLIDLCLAHLSTHPGDGRLRVQLTSLLEPNVCGRYGIARLVSAVLKRAERLPEIRPRPKVSDRPPAIDPEELKPRLERIWNWLRENSAGLILLGQHTLPAEELDLPPDRLLAAVLDAVEYLGDILSDDGDHHLMTLYLAAALAVAPLSHEPDEDLTILRTAAIKLAIAGKMQAARDLAETALVNAGDRPQRHRQALYTFADIYARLGMKSEALIALSAGLEASPDATWDQIWFESNLLFRLLRDVNMPEHAVKVLQRSRRALDELGLADRDRYRIETMELQAQVATLLRQGGSAEETVNLLKLAQENAEAVEAQKDDVMPIALVLNTLIKLAKSLQPSVTKLAEELVDRLVTPLSPTRQRMIRAAGPSPSLADIASLAAAIDEARFADDTGYDLRNLRTLARGLVPAAVDDVDPSVLTYAIEASADRSIYLGDSNGIRISPDRLLLRADAPEKAAAELSLLGVSVVGMALLGDKLATIEFDGGEVREITLHESPIFSNAALQKWNERFPRDYRLEDNCLNADDIRASVANIGLSRLPARSVVIADAQLQRFPSNLLTVGGNYAGYDHAIAVAPSLEWLTASRKLNRTGDGRARMWIPVQSGVAHNAVLKLLADQVGHLLSSEGILLELESEPSPDFARADVTIIGGHGGLAETNRFFQSISDEDHGVTAASEVANFTRHSRLAILFVCSGGRIDPHPETGMAIGLAKQLVARGCSAVIAPAWPIPFFMATPWLQGFLAEWGKGSMLLDAYHAGNQAVGLSSSWDPKRSFAMTLYGDPYIRAEAREHGAP